MVSSHALGIIVAICGSFINSLGLLLQKWGYNRNAALPPEQRSMKFPAIGFGVYVCGNLCDLCALSMTAQTTVSGLAPLVLVGNVLFAPCIVGETVQRKHYVATLVVILACAVITVFGPRSPFAQTSDSGCGAVAHLPNSCHACIESFASNVTADDTETLTVDCLMALFREPSYLVFVSVLLPTIAVNYAGVVRTESRHLVPRDVAPESESEAEGEIDDDAAAKDEAKDEIKDNSSTVTGGEADNKAIGKHKGKLHMMVDPDLYDHTTTQGLWIALTYAFTTATLSSFNVAFSKIVGELVAVSFSSGEDDSNQFRSPMAWVFTIALIVCNANQIRMLSRSLSKFDALFIIPCYQVAFTILCILGGGIYFKEFSLFTTLQWCIFPWGVVAACWGVRMLSASEVKNMERIAALLHEARVAVTVVRAMGKFKRLTKIHHDSGTDDSEQADDRDSSAVPNAFTAAEAEDKAVHSPLSTPTSPSRRVAHRKSSLLVVPGIVSPAIVSTPPEKAGRWLSGRLRQSFKKMRMSKVAPTGTKENGGHFTFLRSMPGLSAFGVRIVDPQTKRSSGIYST